METQRRGCLSCFVLFCLPLLLIRFGHTAWALDFPGPAPKEALARVDDAGFVLENQVLACKWTLASGRLKPTCIVDRLSGANLALDGAECFRFSVARSPGLRQNHGSDRQGLR